MKTLNIKRSDQYMLLLFIGCGLIILELMLFQKAFIDTKVLWYITLSTGVITSLLDFKHYTGTYQLNWYEKLALPLVQNIASWGFISCFIFVSMNHYLANTDFEIKTLPIVQKYMVTEGTYRARPSKAYVAINYNSYFKRLEISAQQFEEIEKYKEVKLKVQRGFFNYYIIAEQKLQ